MTTGQKQLKSLSVIADSKYHQVLKKLAEHKKENSATYRNSKSTGHTVYLIILSRTCSGLTLTSIQYICHVNSKKC